MNPLMVIAVVDGLLGLATRLYDIGKQMAGTMPIPSFDELITKNIKLKEELDTIS